MIIEFQDLGDMGQNCTIEIAYYESLSDSNWRENDYNWTCFEQQRWQIIIFCPLKLLFESELYSTFQVCLHDKNCIFASILLITYKSILYVNKLTWKYNVFNFMTMTWKRFFSWKKITNPNPCLHPVQKLIFKGNS